MKEPSAPRVSTRSAALAAASKVVNLLKEDMHVLTFLSICTLDNFSTLPWIGGHNLSNCFGGRDWIDDIGHHVNNTIVRLDICLLHPLPIDGHKSLKYTAVLH